jgi:hypothetical protein
MMCPTQKSPHMIVRSLIVALALLTGSMVHADIITVDPKNGPLKLLDFGAMRVASGDTLVIANGVYRECAVFKASNITIRAQTPGKVIIRDQSCNGKGILVITGNNVVVEGLVLQGARVADGNGAGIRFEGSGLTVRNMTFIENQNGILSNGAPDSTITIENSVFDRNGTCENAAGCAHAIYINQAALLKVVDSRFVGTRSGHHIKSRATKTIVQDNIIDDGATGTASYAIQLAQGGDGLITGNTITKGPRAENTSTAIFIGGEGDNPFTAPVLISGNTFINKTGVKPYFVYNASGNVVRVVKNTITGTAVLVSGKNRQK